MALGARSTDILKMILGEGLRLGASGILLGTVLALALSRFLSRFLFQVSVFDPLTFSVVAVILLAATSLACYLPARRVSRVEPNRALRHE